MPYRNSDVVDEVQHGEKGGAVGDVVVEEVALVLHRLVAKQEVGAVDGEASLSLEPGLEAAHRHGDADHHLQLEVQLRHLQGHHVVVLGHDQDGGAWWRNIRSTMIIKDDASDKNNYVTSVLISPLRLGHHGVPGDVTASPPW